MGVISIATINFIGAIAILSLIVLAANAAEENGNESIASDNPYSNNSIDANGEELEFNTASEQETAANVYKTNEDAQDVINSAETNPLDILRKETAASASFGVYLQIVG